MANLDKIRRLLENVLGLPNNSLNAALADGLPISQRIGYVEQDVGTKAPKFEGKEDEDVEEWIIKIEALFISSGRAAGNNNANIAQFAIGGLGGKALQWYSERKNANAGHLVRWTNDGDDESLKQRIREKFAGGEVQVRKLQEIHSIKQKDKESIDDYHLRFKRLLRIVEREGDWNEILKAEYFTRGLRPEIRNDVRKLGPRTLEDAV